VPDWPNKQLCARAHFATADNSLSSEYRRKEKAMKPVIAIGVFGTVAIALAAEALNVAMALGEFTYMTPYNAGFF
jgi:hypothetical protein